MILIVDNYDSFTYNLVDIVTQYMPNEDDVTVLYPDDEKVMNQDVDGVIISPGPGHPLDNKWLVNIIERYKDKPILGVCLGAQALTCYYDGKVIQGETVMHGKVDEIKQNGTSILYRDLPLNFNVMRYHSLVSDAKHFPKSLIITGTTNDCIQSFEHENQLHFGIQYHPESFATEYGEDIIKNFINLAVKGD
ncbi:glutamine amidotransferase [Staphylococcus pasteuri]|uniref:anthranilate synthase component II n=1 Tax=Staphylococcus pasteuri TaxID=45972 RepID=UPI000D3A5401|nr:aminodeoxychorismate/anthranilate synthase component II [Staphylococcus pasteuri]MCT1925773.1 aminodeoxychorismate/anthranilate synthase component II [Staphylococcus pasteuri]PTU85762.1 glutamine amidotransferase [Staphylococcus pasteuri]